MQHKRKNRVVHRRRPAVLLPTTDYRLLTAGFTLVEVLVTLAIISTILMMVYGSYAATSQSLDLYSRRMACDERAGLVLRLMARQLRGAYRPAPPSNPIPVPGPQGSLPHTPRIVASETSPSAAFRADPHAANGEILSFTTTNGLSAGLDRPASLSRVMYGYHPSNQTLSLYCRPEVYQANSLRDSSYWRPLLSGVTSVDLQFYDGQQWQRTWDGGDSGTLPQAVKIAFTIIDERGRAHRFGTAVPIGCRNAPQKRQVGMPAGRL